LVYSVNANVLGEGNGMKMKSFSVCFLVFLIVVFVTPVYCAGEGEWIENYTVEDLETGQVYLELDFNTGEIIEYSPLFDRSELNVTLTVNIPITVSHVDLRIATHLEHSSINDRYWQVQSAGYAFEDYNPNQKYLEFTQVKGTFTISCYGKIPYGITQTRAGDYILHKPTDFVTVRLSGPGGELIDHIETEVLDAEIDEYRKLLDARSEKLDTIQDSGVAPGYVELFESVLDQAEVQAELGFVDEAISLLDLLAVSQEPVSSIAETVFLPVMGALGIAAVAMGFLYIRARSNRSYVLSVIEDQIKDLEGLTLRVSKFDRTLSTRLDSMKERLKKLIWA